MIISCNTIVDRRDHVQYLTVSKSYSDNCTCSQTEQNTTLKSLMQRYKLDKRHRKENDKAIFKRKNH